MPFSFNYNGRYFTAQNEKGLFLFRDGFARLSSVVRDSNRIFWNCIFSTREEVTQFIELNKSHFGSFFIPNDFPLLAYKNSQYRVETLSNKVLTAYNLKEKAVEDWLLLATKIKYDPCQPCYCDLEVLLTIGCRCQGRNKCRFRSIDEGWLI